MTGKKAPDGFATGPIGKGQRAVVRVESMAGGGEAVARFNGMPIFVSRLAPGDLVEVEIFDVRKGFGRGHPLKLIEPSSQRAEPPCPLFKVCGGCQWQHLAYEYQLQAKADIVRQAVEHIGKLSADLVLPAIGADDPLYYRNKVQFPVEMVAKTGRILAGYYKENSHELVNIKHCPVQPPVLDSMLAAVKDAAQRHKLSAYSENTHRGYLRHLAARVSFDSNEVLVTLVLNASPPLAEPFLSRLTALADDLMQAVPEVVGVCVNFNEDKGNRIMGKSTVCVAGLDAVTEKLRSHLPDAPAALKSGLAFRLSPNSFFQVNSRQAETLFDLVFEAAVSPGVSREPVIIDAYAGVGTMAQWLSYAAKRVIAIEEVDSAVLDGRENCKINGIENVEFYEGKVEVVLPELSRGGLTADVVVVDPPRKGVEANGLQSVIQLAPARIVYVSCNPATLARDLKILEENGYKTKQIQPIDMFPQTYHVESVTVLEKIT
jgi:23S rRNA (uracil1939-C5)-methyltransferase